MKLKIFLVLLALIAARNVSAQNLKSIEIDLLEKVKKVNYWTNHPVYTKQVDRDKELARANKELVKFLLFYTSSNPNTLTYDFPLLKKNGISIVLSDDQKFKVYSWDDGQGGSQRFWEVVYQYGINKIVKSEQYIRKYQDDCMGNFTKITTRVINGKTRYLTYYYSGY